MAARKKAKGKTRAKRGKATARKPAPRKKALRKTARKKAAPKAPVRRAAPAAKKKVARRPAATAAPTPPSPPPPPGQRVGVVTHYFTDLSVAVVKLESGSLRVGDNIHFRGHTTDFGQRIDSLQVNHAPVDEVGPNDDFGLKVREHAREHDIVYKIV